MSSQIDEKTVAKIASLSSIRMREEELAPMAQELTGILKWIEQLNEIDVTGVEPMTSVADHIAFLRPDVVSDGDIRDKVLANAPEAKEGFFVVPKVVE